jgi:hypothetical protein
MPRLRVVRSLPVPVLLLLLILAGCSSSKNSAYEVSGKVTYQGTPLPGGTITFQSTSDKDKVGRTGINEDGSYKLGNAPVGDVKIYFIGPSRPSDTSKGKAPPVKLDAKYLKPETSGVAYTVKEGVQTFDIDLK